MQTYVIGKLNRAGRWVVILLTVLLVSCAGVDSLTEKQCPQPRFTGKAPEAIYNRVNPFADNDEAVFNGRAIYESQAQPPCRLCHDIKGDGRGPLASQFSIPPRNFSCTETVSGIPDGQLFWIIQNGSPGTSMPGFDQLSERQIWELVIYLRRLSVM